ncbi:class I SAM-dependent DNA methyltransferase [Pedobacter foliorum]|uniref:HsdM family class I SAM-dependent methyltransferase n=1 Tax=Pedobacter foliorum TaxID=2739058 RepID=UPI0015675BEF|nr:N-6 DNA methylase [Pedobacter foliorum]NRF37597.1 SAM-dependent DNA methyltransferase [Pedobacter foliorum]
MNQNVLKFLKEYSYDTWDINRLIVSSFLVINRIDSINNLFIKDFIIAKTDDAEFDYLIKFINLFEDAKFGIEELIEFFEFVISPVDKEVNGAVFTPEYIREFIVKRTTEKINDNSDNYNISNLRFGDIACGCGGFFKTITETLRTKTNKSYYDIYAQNIYGLDIQEYSIVRTKILLSLLAILNNEDCLQFNFNLYCGNALDFDWDTIESIRGNGGFDVIVGNPPYVGVTKIDPETKLLLKNWKVSSTGKPDLYIPFFQIGMENLCNTGILGFITVNTFYKSLNGRSVRNYFSTNEFDLSIVDFGGEQLFKNRSTYTCICLIGKVKSSNVKYVKATSKAINSITQNNFVEIPYSDLDDFNGWYLINDKLQKIIAKIENIGTSLGEKYIIRNGFATLKNNVYLFNPIKENEDFYFFLKEGVEFKIEKKICRDAIKPNTLKSEEELPSKLEKLIFPYIIEKSQNDLFGKEQNSLIIISPEDLELNYPCAFTYLSTQREILSGRDKGMGEYDQWYAFGRNQALTLSGYKLLFPYISDKPNFVFTKDKDLLFYNGYAILSESVDDLLLLKKILMSKIFWFYIKNTSKPYSGNFFSIAKNYIKNFGLCEFTDADRLFLTQSTNQNDIDNFLGKKYGIDVL